MSDIKLFATKNGTAEEIPGTAAALERSLQELIEQNLEVMLGVRLLASEYSTGPKHAGRLDTLGLDENGCPVIIEYKRATNENVINQGLFYLDWLLDHRAEFKLLVMEKLGGEVAGEIDWSAPRLICVAGGFTRYDEHAVQQMNRNIELIRYCRFGDGLLLLELANATSAESVPKDSADPPSPPSAVYKTISETLSELKGPLRDLYDELAAYLKALGDDVQEKPLKYYVAFKRIKNFVCVEVHPAVGCVRAYVKVDPDTIPMEEGYTRDVREIGHLGTGDIEITLKTREDLERAKSLFQQSYEAS
jgi:predicted transport protein